MNLRLGTRGSDLARTQSTTIAEQLNSAGFSTELKIIRTSGDRSDAPSFGSIGPHGVFVREIERALVDRSIDLAVHSFKDLSTSSPPELIVAAVPQRLDPADLLIVRHIALDAGSDDWLPLNPCCRIGTASARRTAWLRHYRPDLIIESLRGNVPTRIRRLHEGHYDAIVLAACGVDRLRAGDRLGDALAGLTVLRLDPERFVPAPAQGALAVQCRQDNDVVRAALAELNDAPSRAAVGAERDALARAEGGCDVAFGAYCLAGESGYELIVMHERDDQVQLARVRGPDPGGLAEQCWLELEAAAI